MNRAGILACAALIAGCTAAPAATDPPSVAPATAVSPSSPVTASATPTGTTATAPTPTTAPEPTATLEPTTRPSATPEPPYAPPTTLEDGIVRIQIPAQPVILIPGDDAVWATTQRGRVHDILAIDPDTNTWREVVAELPAGIDPLHGMGVNGSIWMTGWDSDAATEYDAETGAELVVHPVGSDPVEPVYLDGDVWVLNHHGSTISRIDVDAKEIVATIDLPSPMHPLAMVSGDGLLWVGGPATTELHAIDPETNEVVRTLPAEADCFVEVAYLGDRLWVTRCADGVYVHDPVTGEVVGHVEAAVGFINTAALVDGQRVWLPSFAGGSGGSVGQLVAIDIETLETVAEFDLPQAQFPWRPAAAFDSVWLDSTDGTLLRIPYTVLERVH